MNSSNQVAKIILTMTVAASLVMSSIASADVDELGSNEWTIEQITFTQSAESGEAEISSAGRWIAFSSTADLTGDNPDLNIEVFLYNTRTRQFQQLSNGVGSEDPAISYHGRFIAFSSKDDLNGNTNDATQDIFIFDRIRGTLNQITDGEFAVQPSVSYTGRWIVYENRESGPNIALYDQLKDERVFVTDAQSGFSYGQAISGNGRWITFASTEDLVPGEDSDGSTEVFRYNRINRSFQQITSGTGIEGDAQGSEDPSINFSGRFIAFESTDELVPDVDYDGRNEVYLFDRRSGNIRQITNTKASEAASDPSISANGRRIVFEYSGPDGLDDVVLFDVSTNKFTWITNSVTGFSGGPRISANGRNIVFSSNADLTGGNKDGNFEIFVAYQK